VCVIFQNKNIVFNPFQPLSVKTARVLYQKKNMLAGSFSAGRKTRPNSGVIAAKNAG
jgi:hypothetical protein